MVNHKEENKQNTLTDNDAPILNIFIPYEGFTALLGIQLFYEKEINC